MGIVGYLVLRPGKRAITIEICVGKVFLWLMRQSMCLVESHGRCWLGAVVID